ncbi:hypothetical protein N1851_026404 [Merluccius polli]|uniref:THAP-type domain-containing protein n=1 Tax=Merluccius polli TaxID=89951 RepID=A0AA47NT06_MERPO|nr:hypothetical protein N1851_026404 [Merluccius polli]
MVKRCCYGTCNTDRRYKDRVENPTKDVGKCLRWIKLCGRPHQQLNVNKLKKHGTAKHFYVCSKHFVEGIPTLDHPDPLPASPLDRPSSVRRPPKLRREPQPPRKSATAETIR